MPTKSRLEVVLRKLKPLHERLFQGTPSMQRDVQVWAPRSDPPAVLGEVYSGYSTQELQIFDLFITEDLAPTAGFVTDFLGGRTRTSSLWDAARFYDGMVLARPVPNDLFEAIEWVGLLKSVTSSDETTFRMMELGAGWGPWLVNGANAAKIRHRSKLKLLGVEADPGRFALMKQHFMDNRLDPDAHTLICGAVGITSGVARWPVISDAPNSGGARPVRQEDGVASSDASYMGMTETTPSIEVDVIALPELLARETYWDLVHIDIQGWEAELCGACVEQLTQSVKWLIVGTHSRLIDGRLIEIMHGAGWILENEKPTRFVFDHERASLESMADTDGTQVWRNPDNNRLKARAQDERVSEL